MPALVVIHGDRRGEYFNLQVKAALVVGRDDSLLAQMTGDAGISRRHVEFIRHDTDHKCFAIDLGSSNGVRINGAKIDHSAECHDGDLIQVGHTLLVFVNKDLDDTSPVKTFLKACEKLYGDSLDKMREHDRKMAAREANSNTGTMNLGVATKNRK
ncbi:FHA domain-containing protein [Phycisphaeraceae bacterium D3-23]